MRYELNVKEFSIGMAIAGIGFGIMTAILLSETTLAIGLTCLVVAAVSAGTSERK